MFEGTSKNTAYFNKLLSPYVCCMHLNHEELQLWTLLSQLVVELEALQLAGVCLECNFITQEAQLQVDLQPEHSWEPNWERMQSQRSVESSLTTEETVQR